ncbi:MAG: NAD-dependent epimerase/dehydratase family protein [Planctomycetota bacterium]|jgi:nucleoside-diphosphate-sugar epimerase
MKVLVTGGAGYIGARLVPLLLDGGHEVDVLDKLVFGAESMASFKDKVRLVVKDIRAVDVEDVKGYDAVVHLGGLSNDPTAEFNPGANLSINRDGAVHVAKTAKEAGVRRFVFASSCSIYYTMEPDDTLRDEEYPVDPKAPYSLAKREAEKAISKLADDDFTPVYLRKGTVYGQSDRMRYDLVANTFTKDAFDRRLLTVHSGGRMWRPMLSLSDTIQAYRLAIEAPRETVHNQIINVLSENIQIIDLARKVRRELESRCGVKIEMHVQEVGATRSYIVEGAKGRELLGFEPADALSAEVAAMWDGLEGGIDFTQPVYYNIRWLELLTDMKERLRKMGGDAL